MKPRAGGEPAPWPVGEPVSRYPVKVEATGAAPVQVAGNNLALGIRARMVISPQDRFAPVHGEKGRFFIRSAAPCGEPETSTLLFPFLD